MEPVSILALVNTCLGITTRIGTISNQLWTLKEKYKHVERKVLLFETQLSAINTAVIGLSGWLEGPSTHDELIRRELKRSLDSCEIVIQVITEYLEKVQMQANKMNLWNKTKFLRDEGTIMEYEGMLRGQVQALSLLLHILSLPSRTEQQTEMDRFETTSVLNHARDSSSSLLWLRDTESARTITSLATENVEIVDMTFDFDKLIVTSKVYRSTLASFVKQKIRGDKNIASQADSGTTIPNNSTQGDYIRADTGPEPSTRVPLTGTKPLDQQIKSQQAVESYFARWPLDTSSGSIDDESRKPLTGIDTLLPSKLPQHSEIGAETSNGTLESNQDNDHQTSGTEIEEVDDSLSRISSSPSIADSDIDFEFVYCLHTFRATVEGQANANKGDMLILLDDSNSYWWLIRVAKDSSIGYLPAEHIETPVERLGRLNKHRNIDIPAELPGYKSTKRSKLRATISRKGKKMKEIRFAGSVTFIEADPVTEEMSEEEENSIQGVS